MRPRSSSGVACTRGSPNALALTQGHLLPPHTAALSGSTANAARAEPDGDDITPDQDQPGTDLPELSELPEWKSHAAHTRQLHCLLTSLDCVPATRHAFRLRVMHRRYHAISHGGLAGRPTYVAGATHALSTVGSVNAQAALAARDWPCGVAEVLNAQVMSCATDRGSDSFPSRPEVGHRGWPLSFTWVAYLPLPGEARARGGTDIVAMPTWLAAVTALAEAARVPLGVLADTLKVHLQRKKLFQ